MPKLGCIVCQAATCATWDQRTANRGGFLTSAGDALEEVQVVNGNVSDDEKLHYFLLHGSSTSKRGVYSVCGNLEEFRAFDVLQCHLRRSYVKFSTKSQNHKTSTERQAQMPSKKLTHSRFAPKARETQPLVPTTTYYPNSMRDFSEYPTQAHGLTRETTKIKEFCPDPQNGHPQILNSVRLPTSGTRQHSLQFGFKR